MNSEAKETDSSKFSPSLHRLPIAFLYTGTTFGLMLFIFLTVGVAAGLVKWFLLTVYLLSCVWFFRKLKFEIRRAEDERQVLKDSISSLKHSGEVKNDYLARMSHEIRTPLNALIGFSDLLSATPLNDNQLRQVRTMQASAKLLLDISNDILDVSKIESGAIQLESMEFDLEYLIRTIFDMIQPRLDGRSIELKLVISDPRLHRLKGDPTRLRQILLNLIGNAAKFTEQGVIGVEVKLVKQNHSAAEDCIEFTVWDTGIGIPKERHQIIFESFSQASTDTTRKYGGTGLGLAIVKKLVHLLGGDVKLFSKEGQGSRFVFTVKMKLAEKVSGNSDFKNDIKLMPKALLKGCQAALIMNTHSDATLLTDTLQKNDIQVVTCLSDYQQALHFFSSEKALIHFVVVEPECLTVSEIQNIRKICSKAQFIALTNDAVPGAAKRIQKLGFDAYIAKPFSPDDIPGVLLSVLGDGRIVKDPIVTRHTYPEISKISGARKLPPGKILIAEDNLINQQLIVAYLNEMNFSCDVVSNGAEAVKAAESESYALILMDLQMPEMNGIEAATAMRKRKIQTPIIALTGSVQSEDREQCVEVGMNDFVSKPIDITDLRRKIQQHLK